MGDFLDIFLSNISFHLNLSFTVCIFHNSLFIIRFPTTMMKIKLIYLFPFT